MKGLNPFLVHDICVLPWLASLHKLSLYHILYVPCFSFLTYLRLACFVCSSCVSRWLSSVRDASLAYVWASSVAARCVACVSRVSRISAIVSRSSAIRPRRSASDRCCEERRDCNSASYRERRGRRVRGEAAVS